MNKSTLKSLAVLFCIAFCFIANGIDSVYAYSDSEKANLPQSNYYVQANVWQRLHIFLI